MIVFIKENCFFKNISPRGEMFEVTNERDYILNGYTKVELDNKYIDCEYSDFNDDLTFNLEKYNARKQKAVDVVKLSELTNWFDAYFDKQLTQSQWQDDFTVSHDDYFDKDYANIDELKAQAKIVRDEIRKLRQN